MIALKYKFKSIEQDGNQLVATYELEAPSRYQIAREVMKEYDQDLPNIIWHEQVDTEYLYDWLDQKEER